MATPEQERDAKVLLAESLFNDPGTRPMIEEAIVKKYPQAETMMPGRQAKLAAEAVLKEARELNSDTMAKLREREAKEALTEARREIMDDPALRIRPEEVAAVEALMTDEKGGMIGSHRRAAEFYRAQQQVASPRVQPGQYSTMQVPGVNGAGGDEYKWLGPGVGNPLLLDRVTRERAETILHDISTGHGSKWA